MKQSKGESHNDRPRMSGSVRCTGIWWMLASFLGIFDSEEQEGHFSTGPLYVEGLKVGFRYRRELPLGILAVRSNVGGGSCQS